LPVILTNEDVSAKAMKTITTLVAAQHVGILVSLRTNLTQILGENLVFLHFIKSNLRFDFVGNINKVCAVDMSQLETRTRVLYLLFSASVWRTDILDAVGRQLVNSQEHKDLLDYFVELLEHWYLIFIRRPFVRF
jgi:hypothetical protein